MDKLGFDALYYLRLNVVDRLSLDVVDCLRLEDMAQECFDRFYCFRRQARDYLGCCRDTVDYLRLCLEFLDCRDALFDLGDDIVDDRSCDTVDRLGLDIVHRCGSYARYNLR